MADPVHTAAAGPGLRVLVLQGPNLNRLGKRKTSMYGTMTLAAIQEELDRHAAGLGVTLTHFQSNHEGALIDCIQEHAEAIDAIVINGGALTHYSIALRDALEDARVPVAEIHISNIHRRESFREHSFISSIAVGVIVGFGWRGYLAALNMIVAHVRDQRAAGIAPA